MNYNVWCLDDGYGDNKCVTENKQLIIPSSYADWRPLQQEDFGSSTSRLLDYISVELDGVQYLVGDCAMKQDANNNWFGGENKHLDRGFPIMLNACLGLMANSQSEVVDCLVMGLPVQSDDYGSRIKLLENQVLKDHQMKITLRDGSVLSRNIRIKNLIVKQQPFGSLCDLMLDDNGDIIAKDIATGFNVVVDIGSRTLNIYTLDSLEPVSDFCFHTNGGMYNSYMAVGNYIKSKTGYEIPTGRLPLYIKSKSIKGIDLSEVIDRSFEITAYEIKKVIETKFINSFAYVDRIIFTGGGAELLQPYLSNMFEGKTTVFMDRFSNAKGLRKYGIRQTLKMQLDEGISIKVGSNNVKEV